MQQPDPAAIVSRFNDLFGYGWRKLYAEAIGIRPQTVSEMKPGATLQHAAALAEFFESTPPRYWPDRFNDLRQKRQTKIKREKDKENT